MGVTLEFFREPDAFLKVAAAHLAADPVVGTVVATIATRTAQEVAAGRPVPEADWYVAAVEGGQVVGVGMRTAPFPPRPLYLQPMPDAAARALARVLHERGEPVAGVNGALPAVSVCAEETARLTGRVVEVAHHTRLFELRSLRPPRRVPGALRLVTRDALDLATAWFTDFMADADEQAGRPRGASAH